ncbi:MAG: DNA-directed RNA polymerase subunit beta' [Actinomycetota bacterium]|nr:DNA-directed RNA polymerase subunit beta' [Actinomycetota bacterium]MDK1026519.1 DNA-directed RNA polymerase subunit beta' [Actinomycetota bacterium]MDK1037830.1 DNA-directed RNA polymerase subunit beta' [Actinomycetota bacterium]MDK1097353.1 DNA-directed RNA polymerase subunit beta' [Actinomycetota bacterium]
MPQLFDELKISLASSDQIRSWSYGEVKKPETINYRTLKPEKDGLFDERIFGPTRDWECYCGKYKRVRFRGVICERCGVEVTRSKVRRERMGHIELAAPVTHIWFFKGVPSRLGYLLDMSPKELEKVIYFAAYLVTHVDDEKRTKDLPDLEEAARHERVLITEELEEWRDARLERLEAELAQMEDAGAKPTEINARKKEVEREMKDRDERSQVELELLDEAFDTFKAMKPRQLVESEQLWREIVDRYGEYYTGGMGAEFVKDLIRRMDLQEEVQKLRADLVQDKSQQRRQRAQKRLKVVQPFADGKNDPTAMILDAVPVIPPDLRPMVQLDGGRFATSDMNDLYRRVINRNNRLKRLIDLGAPEIIVNNEKRMLQEAVDALFDNGRRGRAVTGPGNRPLKSLSDMLKGKQGRFRQNLLGKRVDYSGRSVIVVGPQLRLHQCGLPKIMALELFKPFVMKRLVDLDIAQNIKAAKRMVERRRSQVWDVLSDVIQEHPVLLNRAPTLHRLGIQAFEPVLIEGKAIELHPLVCEAFNADFDGDQMAVHLPLSAEAQAEARILMLSSNNVLSPANGRPVVTPSQDMVIGMYYLSAIKEGAPGEGRAFSSVDEAVMAYEAGHISLHARIKVRVGNLAGEPKLHAKLKSMLGDLVDVKPVEAEGLTETTVGRAILNGAFPIGFPYINAELIKADLRTIVEELIHTYDKPDVANTLDNIKELGFRFATRAGLTIGLQDVKTPPEKKKILALFEAEAAKTENLYQKGVITDDERRSELIDIWTRATDEVKDAMQETLQEDPFNPMDMMVRSGARGNIMQLRQIAGMRGLVANPKGDIIPQPIKANFREGLSVLEYFISTHGARKGLADTALRTADSGYLTRRLVDVSQEIIIHGDESHDPGLVITIRENGEPVRHLRNKIIGRVLAEDVKIGRSFAVLPDDRKLRAGFMLDREAVNGIQELEDVGEIRVRSPLTDESPYGVAQMSYGMDLATGVMVEIGTAVGIMAAQSIGEPGTQLTMRTFHTGGIAGEDITHGLPRVTELFEARRPKGVALLAEVGGVIKLETDEDGMRSIIIVDGDEDVVTYALTARAMLRVAEGDIIEPGAQLTDGPLDPKEVLAIQGVRACQRYLVDEVQVVYRSQGVDIHDKHIELIVRQMLRRVRIADPGDGPWLPAELVDGQVFRDANRELVEDGKQPAEGRPELMGITKASLATDSWLSAASFQETTRVLTEASLNAKSDYMRGLKENVIIGQLIPAGTGSTAYQSIEPKLPDAEAPTAADLFGDIDVASADDALPADPAEWLASLGAATPSGDGDSDEE